MERDAATDLVEIEALESDLADVEAELVALEQASADPAPTKQVANPAPAVDGVGQERDLHTTN